MKVNRNILKVWPRPQNKVRQGWVEMITGNVYGGEMLSEAGKMDHICYKGLSMEISSLNAHTEVPVYSLLEKT